MFVYRVGGRELWETEMKKEVEGGGKPQGGSSQEKELWGGRAPEGSEGPTP